MKLETIAIEYRLARLIKMIISMVMLSFVAAASTNSCREIFIIDKNVNLQTRLKIHSSVKDIMRRVENVEFNETLSSSWQSLRERRPELLARENFEFGAIQSVHTFKIEELIQILDNRSFCHSLTEAINAIPSLKGVTPQGLKRMAYALLLAHYLDKEDPQNIRYPKFTLDEFKVVPYFSRFNYLNAKPKIVKTPTNFAQRILLRMEYGYNYSEPATGGSYLKFFEPFNILKLDQDKITVYRPDFKLPLMYDMTINEIAELTRNEKFLHQVSEQILKEISLNRYPEFKNIGFGRVSASSLTVEKTGEYLKKGAQLILAVKKIHEAETHEHSTIKFFSDLATMEGLAVKTFPIAFRFDTRSPEEIKKASGFYPNPAKPLGPIHMHSIDVSTGARFVSVSTKEANTDVLQTIQAGKIGNQTENKMANLEIKDRLINQSLREGLFEPAEKTDLLALYEYKIENIIGVEAGEMVAIKSEKEVVAPFVNKKSITYFRKVYILYGRKYIDTPLHGRVMSSSPLNIAVHYGPWEPFTF